VSDSELAATARKYVFEQRDETHAYNDADLENIRKQLKLNSNSCPDSVLHRHTDALAAMVALAVRVHRVQTSETGENHRLTPAERIADIERHFLVPATLLLSGLEGEDRFKEFSAFWHGYDGFDDDRFREQLTSFIRHTQQHINTMRQHVEKGQPWDAGMGDWFVNLVCALCEYFSHEFKPSRSASGDKGFELIVKTLAAPLFPEPRSFHSAVRSHVENWNYCLHHPDEFMSPLREDRKNSVAE
jgi:hypothetical protein